MLKPLSTIFLCFILTHCFAQPKRNFAVFLSGQYNVTLKDATKENNLNGYGIGCQLFFLNKHNFKPLVDVTFDPLWMDDKVFRTYADGTPIETVETMVNLFAGVSWGLPKMPYISFAAGPSFVSQQTLLGIKPSIGYRFPSNQRCDFKISYVNVFNREARAMQNFSSLSFSFGIRLF